ncbi:competence protein ComEA [Planococcus kocurii]|uniref:Competence protein ComEA n=2 Tax=Caryophanaceae TaxID=186818 RepID=A0ABM5WXH3_9BACL|nr:competence protein ComEA [Planococcus kocurii]
MPTAVIVLLLIYFLFPQSKSETAPATSLELINAESPQQTEPPENEVPVIETTLMIDMKGQVVNPGVYELPAGSRMQDAVQAAGGFTTKADSRAINLALVIVDETSVYVPVVGEEISLPAASSQTASASGSGLIDINLASETELMELPGIGPSKAAAILAYREEVGRFKTPEELTEVTGIGDKTFEQLKDLITAK